MNKDKSKGGGKKELYKFLKNDIDLSKNKKHKYHKRIVVPKKTPDLDKFKKIFTLSSNNDPVIRPDASKNLRQLEQVMTEFNLFKNNHELLQQIEELEKRIAN